MKVLVTGAFGNVGRSSLAALRSRGAEIRILEAPTPKNRRLARSFGSGCELVFGDIRDKEAAKAAVRGVDAICHLAALIPPAADRDVQLTRSVNIGGTANLIAAAKAQPLPPRFVLASSISVYGDRLRNFWIKTDDPLEPNADDAYGATKVEAERLLRESGLPFVILRLSYIVWKEKLACDPIMEFHVSKAAREELGLGDSLYSSSGNVIVPDFATARSLARRINERIDAALLPDKAVRAGRLNAMGFRDVAVSAVDLLSRKPELRAYWKRRYRYIMAPVPESVRRSM